MTQYSKDTLVNNISYVEGICREQINGAIKLGRQDLAEYWKKELADLEKLSEELVAEKII
jgi:hypothetical protein